MRAPLYLTLLALLASCASPDRSVTLRYDRKYNEYHPASVSDTASSPVLQRGTLNPNHRN